MIVYLNGQPLKAASLYPVPLDDGEPITMYTQPVPTTTLFGTVPSGLIVWLEYMEYLDYLEQEHWLDHLN